MKVGFVLLSPRAAPIPSTRIAVLNVLPLLQRLGWQPWIAFEPAQASETPVLPDGLFDAIVRAGCALVVFQKVRGAPVVSLARRLEAHGIATAYLVCDIVEPAMAAATSGTIVVTDFLKSLYPADAQGRVHVVHDGIEHPEVRKTGDPRRGGPLRAVLVTSSALSAVPVLHGVPRNCTLTLVGSFAGGRLRRLQQRRWQWAGMAGRRARRDFLRFLLDPRIRCVPWSEATAYRELLAADVGIIPVDESPTAGAALPPMWARKSENRLTLKMAVGLPVVATPIPAYRPVVDNGINGFLAADVPAWHDALHLLRDPALRQRIGRQARESVLERYSTAAQAQRLSSALRAIAAAPRRDVSG